MLPVATDGVWCWPRLWRLPWKLVVQILAAGSNRDGRRRELELPVASSSKEGDLLDYFLLSTKQLTEVLGARTYGSECSVPIEDHPPRSCQLKLSR